MMSTLIISPHLDDAALSCALRIAAKEVDAVLTVFAGLPSENVAPSNWDVLTRASSAHQRVLDRRTEDVAAWTSLGIRYRHLDHLEEQNERTDLIQLGGEIAAMAREFERVLLPAGIGGHPQHLLVRNTALTAITPDTEIILYGELPYSAFYGWPKADKYLDVEAHWNAEVSNLPRGTAQAPVLVALSETELEFKRALLSHYPSQMSAVSGGSFALFDTTALLAYELEFQVA